MKIQLKLALSSAAIAALAACGGDDGGTAAIPVNTDISVTVLDGPIKDAKVCQDKNNDGVCQTGEPFAITKVDGVAVVTVLTAEKDMYPMVAEVVAGTATDNGTPILTGFVMKTPAGKPSLISPLTTLVQNAVAQTGQTVDAAEAQVKLQTGMTSSLFASFSMDDLAPLDGSVKPAALARMLVLTTQQQAKLVADANAVGTKLPDGITEITQPMLDAVLQKRMQDLLSSIVAALPSAATEESLQAAATALLEEQGIQPAAVATAVAISQTPNAFRPTGVAGADLNYFQFKSATDWYVNSNVFTVAQATPAADGSTSDTPVHWAQRGGPAPFSWGPYNWPARAAQMHWTGSAWSNCPINLPSVSAAALADGSRTYNYCNGLERGLTAKAVALPLDGQTMLSVYNQIKALGYGSVDIANAATVLGAATFPAGAKVQYASGASTAHAVRYNVADDFVNVSPLAVSAGKTDVNDTTAACYQDVPDAPATSLDALIAVATGTPCIQSPGTRPGLNGTTLSSGPRNDWWSATSLFVGRIGSAPHNLENGQSATYYTGNTQVRAALAAGNVARYYACQERFNGSARNCELVGTGSYTIQTLGDARALTFQGLPASLGSQFPDGNTAYVERGGKVNWGWQGKAKSWSGASLNLVAANALFAQLGLPALDPAAPVVLSATSYTAFYTGEYSGARAGRWYATLVQDGSTRCSGYDYVTNATWANQTCTFTLTPTAANSTVANFSLVVGGGLRFSGSYSYYTGIASGGWSVNDSTTDTGSFVGHLEN